MRITGVCDVCIRKQSGDYTCGIVDFIKGITSRVYDGMNWTGQVMWMDPGSAKYQIPIQCFWASKMYFNMLNVIKIKF